MKSPLNTVAAVLRDALRLNVDRLPFTVDTTRSPGGCLEFTVRHTFEQTSGFHPAAVSDDKHEMAAKNSAIRIAKEALISSILGEDQQTSQTPNCPAARSG